MRNSPVRVAEISDLDIKPARVFSGSEPVLVKKRGKVSGVYVPLQKIHRLPDEIRRKVTGAVGHYIAKALSRRGVTNQQSNEDFRAYRRRNR